jgi:Fe-S-cluster containining protein
MSRKELAGNLSAEIERTAYRKRLEIFLACRDAGNVLTLDSLNTGIRLSTIISAAAEIARSADEALATVRDEYRPPLHCKEGCSYCCCKPGVLTSIPELLRILDHVQSTFSADAVSELRERARRYARQIAGRNFNDPVNESVPCPLLVDGRCSVYEVRPLTCRGYNSMNVDACRSAHENRDVLIPIFSLLKDITDGTTVGAAQALKAAGFADSLVDLGTALNIALEAGEGFAEAAIDGGADLSPAENSSMVTELWTQVCETARQVGIDVNLFAGRAK